MGQIRLSDKPCTYVLQKNCTTCDNHLPRVLPICQCIFNMTQESSQWEHPFANRSLVEAATQFALPHYYYRRMLRCDSWADCMLMKAILFSRGWSLDQRGFSITCLFLDLNGESVTVKGTR